MNEEDTAAQVRAIFRLAFAEDKNPELKRAEVEARLALATAIIALHAAEDSSTDVAQMESAVERATEAYRRAMSDFLRSPDR